MQSLSLTILFLILTCVPAHAQVFRPERGNYVHRLEDIEGQFAKKGMHYLNLRPGRAQGNNAYRLDEIRNEYRMKDWYLQDWWSLQDMFELDFEAFLQSEGAKTFNEVKLKQYRRFPFDRKKNVHRKALPSLREWGGLTHPPVKKLQRPLERYHSAYRPLDYKKIESPYFDPALQGRIDVDSRSELSFGNVLEVLEDSDAFYAKKWLITKARETILMSSLVFVCDRSTREIVDLLIQKHREGVKVRIIVDGFISKLLKHRECPKLMARAGIEVIESKGFFKHELKAIYHTKTLVVDNAEAIAGGHNMLDADNTSRGLDFKNRDVDLYVMGPMAKDVAKQFMENWQYHLKRYGNSKGKLSSMDRDYKELLSLMDKERRDGLRGKAHYQRILASSETRMRGVCRFIKQAPYEDRHTVGKAYLHLLERLQNYLVITDPIKTDTLYEKRRHRPLLDRFDNFDMFNRLHIKVQALARAGKKIDYITTGMDMAGNENVAILNEKIRGQLEDGKELRANWSFLQLVASNKFYGVDHFKNLLKDWVPHPSVTVWTHISFMHSKIFYFDRVAASIGSVNFQHNATDQAYESTSICLDEHLNRQLDRVLVQDMVNSVPLVFSNLK